MGTLSRQFILGEPLFIVEGADAWLIPILIGWFIVRTSWFKWVYSWKIIRGIILSMGQVVRLRRIYAAVAIGTRLYPQSPGPTIFVVAFAQAIGTAWGWTLVQWVTMPAGKQASFTSPALDWQGSTIISSVVACIAVIGASRSSNQETQLLVGVALLSWFLFETWGKLLLSGGGGGGGAGGAAGSVKSTNVASKPNVNSGPADAKTNSKKETKKHK